MSLEIRPVTHYYELGGLYSLAERASLMPRILSPIVTVSKGAITSKIKHAIKQFLQDLHNCCSPHSHFALAGSQWRTGRCAVLGCKLKQNANEGCNSCASLAGLILDVLLHVLFYLRSLLNVPQSQ